MSERKQGGFDRPLTFQDIANLAAGPHAPPWLARHLEWWASHLVAARMVDKHRPSKASTKKKLEEVKNAALLLQKVLNDTSMLNDTSIRKLLEIAPLGRIKNVLAWM
jgi:hypothetical protein